MIPAGKRFVHLVVIEELTATQAGHPGDGSWCRVRCDCGLRLLKRSRHLRGGRLHTCGSRSCEIYMDRILAISAKGGRTLQARRITIPAQILELPVSNGALANLLGVSNTTVRRNRSRCEIGAAL